MINYDLEVFIQIYDRHCVGGIMLLSDLERRHRAGKLSVSYNVGMKQVQT
eukprot:UN14469